MFPLYTIGQTGANRNETNSHSNSSGSLAFVYNGSVWKFKSGTSNLGPHSAITPICKLNSVFGHVLAYSPVLVHGSSVYGTIIGRNARSSSWKTVMYTGSDAYGAYKILWEWTAGKKRMRIAGGPIMQQNKYGSGEDTGFCYSRNGMLYGVTLEGGVLGGGTVFSFNPHSKAYALLHSFGGIGAGNVNNDGAHPSQQLACYGHKLFGTTCRGGKFGHGVLFRLVLKNHAFRVMHNFQSRAREYGEGLVLQPVLLTSDNLIVGCRPHGGSFGTGAIYSIQPNGTDYRVLHSFRPVEKQDRASNADGMEPLGLVPCSSGYIVGITSWGGKFDGGTVFEMRNDGSHFRVIYQDS